MTANLTQQLNAIEAALADGVDVCRLAAAIDRLLKDLDSEHRARRARVFARLAQWERAA